MEPKNSEDYIKESHKKRKIARDLFYLKPLLNEIKSLEPSITFREAKKIVDFKKFNEDSMLMISNKDIFRHISTMALIRDFNRFTTYNVFALEELVDIWFNARGTKAKQDLMNCDILILSSNKTYENSYGTIDIVLPEILSSRRCYHKHTWIFISGLAEESSRIKQHIIPYVKHTYIVNY